MIQVRAAPRRQGQRVTLVDIEHHRRCHIQGVCVGMRVCACVCVCVCVYYLAQGDESGGCRGRERQHVCVIRHAGRCDRSTPGNVSPILAIRRLGGVRRVVDSDALPYVYTLSFGIPNTTLRVEIPVNISLPYACCVADDSRHERKQCEMKWRGGDG